MRIYFFIIFIMLCFIRCSSVESISSEADLPTIIIINETFIPDQIDIALGDTLIVINRDDFSYHLKSQDNTDVFIDNGEFESEILTSHSSRELVLPEDLIAGDTLFLFDANLQENMTTPNLVINIVN